MLAYRCPARLSWCWLLLTVLTGCQTTATKGPIYKLPAMEERALTVPVAVSITDKRPAKERDYLPGAITPVDYQQGIETLTLDNFEPQLADLLKQAFAQRLSTLSPAPTWADVEVTRFRVLIDRREILAEAYDQQLEAEELAPVVGLGAGMVDGSVGGIVGGVGAGLVTAAVAANKRKEVASHRTAWGHAEPGVTCEITLHVQLHWPHDRREVFDLQAQTHSMAPSYGEFNDVLNELKWNISPTVQQAIIQISTQLQARAELALRQSPAVSSAPAKRLPAGDSPTGPSNEVDPELEGVEPLPPPLNSGE